MASIGLCMIVKNEAHIIRRCLESVLRLVDYVLIVDTGSNDGTQKVIRTFLQEKNLPGEVIEEPWRDFAYNRSFALRKLREKADIDYGLMIDADNVLVYSPDFDVANFKKSLHHELYDVSLYSGIITYLLPLLFSNRVDFEYKGVLHEFLDSNVAKSRGAAQGFYNHQIQDSARNRNPRKYLDDADVLEKALKSETDPFMISRYTFYLAQSYKDAGEQVKALENYILRSQLGFWDQEVYYSLYKAAQQMEALNYPDAEIIQTYLAAFEVCPRAEALHGAMRFCRLRNKYRQGYMLGKHAIGLSYPVSALFVENWIYDYGALDEFSIAAYWAGYYSESLEAAQKLLIENKLPQNNRERVVKNAGFAMEKLGGH